MRNLPPWEFLERVEAGEEVQPTDKNYKAYIGQDKFYFETMSYEQRVKFIELYNAGKVKIGYPGYFYAGLFFMKFYRKNLNPSE